MKNEFDTSIQDLQDRLRMAELKPPLIDHVFSAKMLNLFVDHRVAMLENTMVIISPGAEDEGRRFLRRAVLMDINIHFPSLNEFVAASRDARKAFAVLSEALSIAPMQTNREQGFIELIQIANQTLGLPEGPTPSRRAKSLTQDHSSFKKARNRVISKAAYTQKRT